MSLRDPQRALVSRFREFSPNTLGEFLKKGYKQRYFFPHKIYFLPRCGPDGYKMANWMVGKTNPNQLWEVILYAASPVLGEFPQELYFNDDIVWHQQQLGRTGQIASANLVVVGSALYGNNYLSDLVQRISKIRSFKTRVENRFKGWPYMLLNSILNFALENNINRVYSPTADFVLQHTDPNRKVQRDLFDRLYDAAVNKHYRVRREGNWWRINTTENQDRIIIPDRKEEANDNEKAICLYHDIERGIGHVGIDSNLVTFSENMSPKYLTEMLRIEKNMDVKATYTVVGQFLNEVRHSIEKDGHSLAFHSFNHKVPKIWSQLSRHPKIFSMILNLIAKSRLKSIGNQLGKCRDVDYRLKGYRVAQSTLTDELNDKNLCFHNFEWLGCWMPPDKTQAPHLENRIVKIPMQYDDWKMYKKRIEYQDWEQKAIKIIQENDFSAIGLHDCYAQYWLAHYEGFLKKIRNLGRLKTVNKVANEVFLAHAQ